ncbi:MAG: hypothetical protein RJA81_1815 [Planctomycetota bacterium]|jgi:catechol 2,3-dioxygenase-like lactoylglutathione lyase family enzyme
MSYVALATLRFDEMLAFYSQKLGLKVIESFDRSNARGAFIDLRGGSRLELIDASRQSRPMKLGNQADDRFHIVIETDDISQDAATLDLPEPQKTSWSASIIALRDPDNVSIWFLQWDQV